MARVTLDTVEPNDETLQAFLTENQIDAIVIQKCSSNGWPEIEYRGTKNALKEMIHSFWNDDDLWEYIVD